MKLQIAREYRAKFGWEMPTRKLARIMAGELPDIFNSLEDARYCLRRIENKTGPQHASEGYANIPPRPANPYKLPESQATKRETMTLPEVCDNILVISDLHIPYHDLEAVTMAIRYGIENKVNTILINGDLIDFYNMSRFQKDPRKRSIRFEIDTAKAFLVQLRAVFPSAAIYWLKGNHCIRYEHWLMTKAHEVFDDPYYQLEHRLKLQEERVTILDDKTLVKAGMLSITHGHHIMKGFFAPVNSSRGAWLRAKQSVLIGHVHKVSNHVEVSLDGKVYGCWSTGCLCDLHPDYNPLVSNYQHGFAHVVVDKSGDYMVKNYQIIDGKIH